MRVMQSLAADSSDDFRDTLTDPTAPLGTLTVGGTSQGDVETIGDRDVFSISLIAGQVYTFSARGADSSGGTNPDPVLDLLNSAGTLLEWNDDANGGTFDSLITYTAASTGTFYLVASGYDTTGTYTLSAASGAPADDFRDTLSDTTAPLGTLTVGGSRQGDVETVGDTDVFSISLIAGQVYAFLARGTDSGGGTIADPILGLIDGAGTLLASNDDSDDVTYDSLITYTATSTGTFYLVAGGFDTATGTYTLSAATNALKDVRNDFNGDGRSDVLWRHDTGLLTEWLGQANGSFADNGANAFANIATTWSVAGTGDFNGDGRDDILWRHDAGHLTEWLGQANGGFVDNGANAFATIGTSWSVTGIGDFNGDGRDDILWRHDTGLLTEWLGQANGSFADNGANAFANIATSWSVTGTGDFNGDGRDDILWRHDSGHLTQWLGQANGGFVDNGANAFATIGPSWWVTGIGDFNGDGRNDILWRHDTGLLTEWLGQANGSFADNGANAFANIATSWSVASIGDYNGDGRDDILWRHDSGHLTGWLGQANGSFVDNGANAFATIGTSWLVQPDALV